MKKISFITMMLLLYSSLLFAQVTIVADSSTISSSEMTEIKLNDHGKLMMIGARRDTIAYPDQKLLLQTGNVGIGVESPSVKLQVAGKIAAEYGYSDSASYVFGDGVENTGFSSPDPYTIATIINGVEIARFTSDGSLGVGTSYPDTTALVDITSTTKGFLPPRMTST